MNKINSYTYEETFVGMEFTINRFISREMIINFSKYTGDFHPIHENENFSVNLGFKSIIAHGMLVSSFSSALIGMLLPGKNMILLSQKFDYLTPVYPDTTINIIGVINRKIDVLKVVFIDVSIKLITGEIVSKGEVKIKMLK